ncbi:hypothetical protein NKH37_33560 [Mesorhizobium sp. M1217]|uniref:hypothetical protein n=1 Tax=Mesorhizobium sp. M1217 TaxID=2957070 RepID=UPI003337E53A
MGDGHTLSDGGYRGLFVTSGTVRVEDLKITDALVQDGNTPDGLPKVSGCWPTHKLGGVRRF